MKHRIPRSVVPGGVYPMIDIAVQRIGAGSLVVRSTESGMVEPGHWGDAVTGATRSGRQRVLVVTFDFPPSLEVGAHACDQLTRYLPHYGWEPVILTVDERYIANRDASLTRPFPGPIIRTRMLSHPLDVWARLKRACQHDVSRDLRRTNVPAVSNAELGCVRRWILSCLKAPDDYTGWLPIAAITGIREVRRRGIQHVMSSGPHWTNHLIGLCIAAITRLPWTAHFRDPWMGIPLWKPVSRLSMRLEAALEAAVIRRSTNVVCVTEQHTALLRQRYPHALREKFTTITNGYDEQEWERVGDAAVGGGPERFIITYAGSFYQKRNPIPLFRAVRNLIDAGDIQEKLVQVELIGWCDVADGTRVLEAVRQLGLDEVVDFTGPLSRAATLPRMARSDLLLLLAEAQPYQIPGKTYEYLRARRPILALTRQGAVTELLRDLPGARVVDPDDADGIVAAVREEFARWRDGGEGLHPANEFVSRFDRRRLAGSLAALFARGLSGRVIGPTTEAS